MKETGGEIILSGIGEDGLEVAGDTITREFEI